MADGAGLEAAGGFGHHGAVILLVDVALLAAVYLRGGGMFATERREAVGIPVRVRAGPGALQAGADVPAVVQPVIQHDGGQGAVVVQPRVPLRIVAADRHVQEQGAVTQGERAGQPLLRFFAPPWRALKRGLFLQIT